MLSDDFLEAMSQRGIMLDCIPGEAHEQMGTTERVIRSVWESALRLTQDGSDLNDAVPRCIMAQNTVDRVIGYAPCQWAFGKLPTW